MSKREKRQAKQKINQLEREREYKIGLRDRFEMTSLPYARLNDEIIGIELALNFLYDRVKK